MYFIIWTYRVKAGCEAEFETHYGADGTWASFFRKGEGYLGTELHRDTERPRTYCTIDRWESQRHYEQFSEQYRDEYKAIDERCDALTEEETRIGAYEAP